jgi:glycosyltransferase involved in cell wall biosynthesis
MFNRPLIICLTPVRNEAWILDTFLKCTSLWADHIIIADQNSTDGSREIALRYPKVILIDNNSSRYDEYGRQQLLLKEARKIPGQRLLITLDADEFFTADYAQTSDWQLMLNARPGDSFGFKWINIRPGFKEYWASEHFPWAFMDDNSDHNGKLIHSPRLPVSPGIAARNLDQISVLHYQYTDWARMESKQRYYQCLERINHPATSPINIYRMYHHMHAVEKKDCLLTSEAWFKNYELLGIGVRNLEFDSRYWFDEAVLTMFNEYGTKRFKREAIWSVDWKQMARNFGMTNDKEFADPRSIFEKILHYWLNISQFKYRSFNVKKIDSLVDRVMLKFKF